MGLFFACFSFSGFWYDLERCDSRFVAAMMIDALILVDARGPIGVALAGLGFGMGFLIEQPALVFAAAGVGGLGSLSRPAHAAWFAAVVAGVVGAGTIALDRASGGWFSHYVFALPLSHGVDSTLWSTLMRDGGRAFALSAATLAALVGSALEARAGAGGTRAVGYVPRRARRIPYRDRDGGSSPSRSTVQGVLCLREPSSVDRHLAGRTVVVPVVELPFNPNPLA